MIIDVHDHEHAGDRQQAYCGSHDNGPNKAAPLALFRHQTADSKLTRSEALREAMTALIDGRGFSDKNGKMIFAYAHPLFWAPYTIIGDGGM